MQWVSTQLPGIINMSIGGSKSEIVNRLVKTMTSRGWKFVVAAGNDNQNACNYSPASAVEALTVGAIDATNRVPSFSNYGQCVDMLAPGDSVLSAYPNGLLAYMSGTSMASPIVAGIWSLYPQARQADVLRMGLLNRVFKPPAATVNRIAYAPSVNNANNCE